jgi:hypothetical protein
MVQIYTLTVNFNTQFVLIIFFEVNYYPFNQNINRYLIPLRNLTVTKYEDIILKSVFFYYICMISDYLYNYLNKRYFRK